MMVKNYEIYKCEHCGNIVQVMHGGGADLFCCGEEMPQQSENTTDAATEKHIPVIERTDGCLKVTVGSTAHPMTEAHYIEWIELIIGDKRCLHYLKPSDVPEAVFCIDAKDVSVRAYCNIHGLWKA